MDIQIVKAGTIPIEQFEDIQVYSYKRLFGAMGGSTVTLISGEKNVLVDTGHDGEEDLSEINLTRNKKILLAHLGGLGLAPNDIDIVFLTHGHRDHTGNIHIFEESGANIVRYDEVDENDEIIKDVIVLDTKGHTVDHKSLLVKVGDTKVVVAGDAIVTPTHYIMDDIWRYAGGTDVKKALRSMKKIIKIADYIIPGHGTLFRNVKKKTMWLSLYRKPRKFFIFDKSYV